MSVNKVILVGNVGRDPEVRYAGESKVATFTLATSERYKDRNGENKENTEWHNIVAWRQSADVCEKFVKKGTQLYIEGKLRTRSYDQNGVKKYVTEIVVDTLQLLGRRPDSEDGFPGGIPSGYQQQRSYGAPASPAQGTGAPAYSAGQASAGAPASPAATPAISIEDNPSDDLPF